jgi:hypothetical protein
MRSSARLGKINPFEGLIEIHTSAPRHFGLVPARWPWGKGSCRRDQSALAANWPPCLTFSVLQGSFVGQPVEA